MTKDAKEDGMVGRDDVAAGKENDPISPLDRRRFLKAGSVILGGAAAYSAPSFAMAGPGSLSPALLSLPFRFSGPVPGAPYRLTLPNGATYDFAGSVDIAINSGGLITATNATIVGIYVSGSNVSGSNSVGQITITQSGPGSGQLNGTSLYVPTIPILYADENNQGAPGTMRVSGTVTSSAIGLFTDVVVDGVGSIKGANVNTNCSCL